MQSIANLIGKVVGIGESNSLKLHMRVLDNWEYIIGEDLKGVATLEAIRGRNIIINIVSASAIMLKGRERVVLERVNNMVQEILFTKIIIKHCLTGEKVNAA